MSCLCYCMATGRSCTWSPHLQSAWWRLSLHWALIFIWRISDEVTQHKTPTNARQQQGITTALLVDLRRTVPWSLAGLVRCGHRLWTEKRRADSSLGVVVYYSQPRTGRGKLSAKPSAETKDQARQIFSLNPEHFAPGKLLVTFYPYPDTQTKPAFLTFHHVS